jgi:hypothetical protein
VLFVFARLPLLFTLTAGWIGERDAGNPLVATLENVTFVRFAHRQLSFWNV